VANFGSKEKVITKELELMFLRHSDLSSKLKLPGKSREQRLLKRLGKSLKQQEESLNKLNLLKLLFLYSQPDLIQVTIAKLKSIVKNSRYLKIQIKT